jgi:hypothetical protein
MTSQPTAAAAGHARTLHTEARHRHDSACFWDLDDCRWQCATYPLLGYALERCTATGPSVPDRGPEPRP